MLTSADFVAPQHLDSVSKNLGSELCRTLECMKHKLAEMVCQGTRRAAREYVELREANSLINMMKYTGATTLVRQDEIAWALGYVSHHFVQGNASWLQLLSQAADMVGVDISKPHPMPLDLARRIENELALLSRFRAA